MPSATDLPARVAARSRSEARIRTDRLLARLVFIVQCGVGAALAWWLAKDVFDHPLPFFAPVTAIITLGLSYGQRVRRAVEVMLGVAIGVLIGDVFAHLFGSGVLQLLVVIMLAMTIASLFGAGLLITIQAGVQAAIITTLVAAPGRRSPAGSTPSSVAALPCSSAPSRLRPGSTARDSRPPASSRRSPPSSPTPLASSARVTPSSPRGRSNGHAPPRPCSTS